MKILEIADRQQIDNFLITNPGESGSEFLLCSDWVKILEAENKQIKFFAVLDNALNDSHDDNGDNFLALVLLIKKSLGFGLFYYYAPRGPVLKSGLGETQVKETINFLISEIKKREDGAVFLKIEPANLSEVWRSGFAVAPDIQPKKTLILDLKQSAEDLLLSMHQKTRYNIKLAEKKGVQIIEGGENSFSEFWRLMELTGKRDGFRIHDKHHYLNLIKGNSEFLSLFFAEYQGQKIATALVCFFGDKATYLHGASDNAFRNIMAPYLLQWEIIKKAKELNFSKYDFYGIDEQKWPGVTRFKLGFSGEEKIYPGVFDIIFRPGVFNIYHKLKKIKQKFL